MGLFIHHTKGGNFEKQANNTSAWMFASALVMIVIYFVLFYSSLQNIQWAHTKIDRSDPGTLVTTRSGIDQIFTNFIILGTLVPVMMLFAMIFWRESRWFRGFYLVIVVIAFLLTLLSFIWLCIQAARCNDPAYPYDICNSVDYCCVYYNTTSCPNDYDCGVTILPGQLSWNEPFLALFILSIIIWLLILIMGIIVPAYSYFPSIIRLLNFIRSNRSPSILSAEREVEAEAESESASASEEEKEKVESKPKKHYTRITQDEVVIANSLPITTKPRSKHNNEVDENVQQTPPPSPPTIDVTAKPTLVQVQTFPTLNTTFGGIDLKPFVH